MCGVKNSCAKVACGGFRTLVEGFTVVGITIAPHCDLCCLSSLTLFEPFKTDGSTGWTNEPSNRALGRFNVWSGPKFYAHDAPWHVKDDLILRVYM